MPQPFLETGQNCLLVPSFHMDHPVGVEPRRRQARREQIRIALAPQDLPRQTRHDAGCKQGCRGAMQRPVAGAANLMQRPQGKAAAGQAGIHLCHPKGQNPRDAALRRFQTADFFAQKIDGGG